MWVEFTIRLRQTGWARQIMTNNLTGVEVARRVREHLITSGGHKPALTEYKDSRHSKDTKQGYLEDLVISYHVRHLGACDIYWIEDTSSGNKGCFFVVGERRSPGEPARFALDVYKNIKAEIPRAYKLTWHSLTMSGVEHEFGISEVTFTEDALAAVIVCVAWTLFMMALRGAPQSIMDFAKGFGVNAVYATSVAVTTWMIRRRTDRKVVYRGGK